MDAAGDTNGDGDSRNGGSANGHAERAAEVEGSAETRGQRLTHAQLRARLLESAAGGSALIEEPLDSGLWPTAGLTADEIDLLGRQLDATRPEPKKVQK